MDTSERIEIFTKYAKRNGKLVVFLAVSFVTVELWNTINAKRLGGEPFRWFSNLTSIEKSDESLEGINDDYELQPEMQFKLFVNVPLLIATLFMIIALWTEGRCGSLKPMKLVLWYEATLFAFTTLFPLLGQFDQKCYTAVFTSSVFLALVIYVHNTLNVLETMYAPRYGSVTILTVITKPVAEQIKKQTAKPEDKEPILPDDLKPVVTADEMGKVNP